MRLVVVLLKIVQLSHFVLLIIQIPGTLNLTSVQLEIVPEIFINVRNLINVLQVRFAVLPITPLDPMLV